MSSSSSSFSSYLDFIVQEVSIYFGFPILIGGTIGNILNIMVFLSLRTFRQRSCVFYLIVMSIVNIGQLTTGALARIMTSGFNTDWTQTSLFFCKLRYFIFPATSLISFTCICLATIDQYLATSFRPRWQQWSNIKIARRLTIFFVILWTLHGIPYLILFEQVNSSNKITCLASSPIFLQYRSYFISLILTGFLPVGITIVFGSLAYYNVRKMNYRTVPLVRRELDKQLTTMVLTQDVLNFFTVLPFSIMNALSLNTNLTNDPIIAMEIRFAMTISVLFYYAYFAVSIQRELIIEYFSLSFRVHFSFLYVHPNDFVDN
jgi:hypothetical protein